MVLIRSLGLLGIAGLLGCASAAPPHDAVTLTGATSHRQRPPYAAHPDRLPITLQDHASPVRFRNIWVRDLER